MLTQIDPIAATRRNVSLRPPLEQPAGGFFFERCNRHNNPMLLLAGQRGQAKCLLARRGWPLETRMNSASSAFWPVGHPFSFIDKKKERKEDCVLKVNEEV